jgi:ATP adenylyltransferase/5',5'''-P-1,P-4-tetraphosphate phosphorylase II
LGAVGLLTDYDRFKNCMPQLLKTGYAAPTYMMVMDPKLKVIQSWVNTEDNVPKNYNLLVKFTGKSV